jgi:group I intron endonuclease
MYVYLITNKITNDCYVGKTKTSIEKRFKRHCYLSKTVNTFLYKAMRKYGIENFYAELLEETMDLFSLNELEKKYILIMNPRYNMTEGGDGGDTSSSIAYKNYMKMRSQQISGENNPFYGKKHTEETKIKISERKKGTIVSEETKEKLRKKNLGKKMSKESIEKTVSANSKTYYLIDPNGNPITVKNLSKFCRDNNLDQRNMCNMYSGKYKSSKGYRRNYELEESFGELL